MRDKAVSQPGLYEGPMVFIASYNASGDFASSTTDITVFSNCDEVRLYRNEKLIELRHGKNGHLCFVRLSRKVRQSGVRLPNAGEYVKLER
ncbi:MAG: hypothetical protein ACLRS8_17275 [Parabacteroides merdae]